MNAKRSACVELLRQQPEFLLLLLGQQFCLVLLGLPSESVAKSVQRLLPLLGSNLAGRCAVKVKPDVGLRHDLQVARRGRMHPQGHLEFLSAHVG